MDESRIEASTDVLVNTKPAKRLPQYLAASCTCMCAVSLGNSLGWMSPAGFAFDNGTYIEEVITFEDQSWVGSLLPLGAAIAALPMGFLVDIFGRKWPMFSLVLLFILGWVLLMFPNGIEMVFAGRFILGLAGGAYLVAAPCYLTEILHGRLLVPLRKNPQTMIAEGVLLIYSTSTALDLTTQTYMCITSPLLFAVTFFFLPESPLFLISKGNEEGAKKSLKFLRGKNYDIDFEISEIRETLEKARSENLSMVERFSTKAAKRALVICLGLMLFQQFSGVYAIIFYNYEIFKAAGYGVESAKGLTIIVSAVFFVSTIISNIVSRFVGKKILLLCSAGVMFICHLLMGIFFYLKEHDENINGIDLVPAVSACIFMAGFSLGFASIPMEMVYELFPQSMKVYAISLASSFHWILAFLVTKLFSNLSDAMGLGPIFWLFMAITAVGVVFVAFVVREGEAVKEIQRELEGGK